MIHLLHKGMVACYAQKLDEWLSRSPETRNDPRPEQPESPYVFTAMESDCNECRAAVLVQPVEYSKVKKEGDVSVPTNISKHPEYVPEPMPDADQIIAEKRENVDGLSKWKRSKNGVKKRS